MNLNDDFEDHSRMSSMLGLTFIGATVVLAFIIILVLLTNSSKFSKNTVVVEDNSASQENTYPNTEDIISGSELKPSDLDFWDKYPEKNENKEAAPDNKEDEEPEIKIDDPATDGKHTLIEYANGKEEWLLISPHLNKNSYDFTNLVMQSNIMKYYVDGKQVSFTGVDVSKYQDYIDFNKVKKAGVDFVMIRVGARGYSTGSIVMDDYFADNIKRATDAGLKVGLYFFSQAINEDEAREEAKVVLDSIGEYKIEYPIAYDMEYAVNDTSRIEALSKADKTTVAKAFLDEIGANGYIPMVYGNKEWLLKNVDISKLSSYDIWLSQVKDIPDYPYQFTMWQYNTSASIDGIVGYADLNISFIDYSEK